MTSRLQGEDAAWLHMEDATNPMVVSAILELGGRLSLADVRALQARLVRLVPRLRQRVRDGAPPCWVDDERFDLDAHVTAARADDLATFVSARVSELLPTDRPLWHVHVIEGERTTLLCRTHHAIADGFALLRLLLSLADFAGADRATSTRAPPHAPSIVRAASLAHLVTLPRDPRTVLKRRLTREKRVAWSRGRSLEETKKIARRHDATVNDVLVACVAGALRDQVIAAGDDPSRVRAMVPVNLRDPSDTSTIGNRFGLVVLSLPADVADAGDRVRAVKRSMDRLKRSPQALVAHDLLRVMGHLPHRIEELGVAFFGKKASLVLTNVPGPRERLYLSGVPIERLMFWVPQAAKMGLGVSVFSYAGEILFGVLSDVSVLAHPERLVASMDRDLDHLALE